jgi:hypothetical protein
VRISFIHAGNAGMASYRYRAQIPARELGASINDFTADVLIFAKPQAVEVEIAKDAQARGAKVIADFCDDHFDLPHYREMLKLADEVTCPTEVMATRIGAKVVPDPYEFPEVLPHCAGGRLLWFGNATNIRSLQRVLPKLAGHSLRVVSNAPGCVPWSTETMFQEFLAADIVILPATKEYKSPNRAIESIRQGCYVVAEPHPSLTGLPIYIGDIPEGIEWARQNLQEANEQTKRAQDFIRSSFSPKTQADAWRKVLAGLACI